MTLKSTKYQKGRTSLPSIHIHSPTRGTCSLLSYINTIKRPRFDVWPGFRYYITSASSSRMKSSLKQRPAGSFVTIWYSGTDFHGVLCWVWYSPAWDLAPRYYPGVCFVGGEFLWRVAQWWIQCSCQSWRWLRRKTEVVPARMSSFHTVRRGLELGLLWDSVEWWTDRRIWRTDPSRSCFLRAWSRGHPDCAVGCLSANLQLH